MATGTQKEKKKKLDLRRCGEVNSTNKHVRSELIFHRGLARDQNP